MNKNKLMFKQRKFVLRQRVESHKSSVQTLKFDKMFIDLREILLIIRSIKI